MLQKKGRITGRGGERILMENGSKGLAFPIAFPLTDVLPLRSEDINLRITGFVINFNLNTLSIFPYSKAKGVPKFADIFFVV